MCKPATFRHIQESVRPALMQEVDPTDTIRYLTERGVSFFDDAAVLNIIKLAASHLIPGNSAFCLLADLVVE